MMKEDVAMQGFLTENAAAPGNNTSSVANFNPVLISLVRRAMPNLIAYDVAGVQPMNGPTGLIFAMKARYQGGSTSNREALFNEAETQFSGDSSGSHDSDNASGWNGIDSEGARLTSLALLVCQLTMQKHWVQLVVHLSTKWVSQLRNQL